MSASPIFIIGAARSGTKFLRDCLRADERICAVPYDVNYIWRYGQPNGTHDVIAADSVDEAQIRFIRKAIGQQARLKNDGILLEKTVSNSLRVPLVETVFPDARYIHLVRDGRDVAVSAMREWAAPPDYRRLLEKLMRIPFSNLPYVFWFMRNSILGGGSKDSDHVKVWGPRYPGIEEDTKARSLAEVCAIQWQKSVEQSLADFAAIPDDRVFTIRYEDLVSDGSKITALAQGLQLDAGAISSSWEATVNPGKKRDLTPEQKAVRAQVEAVLSETLQSLDYSLETQS
ncbi:MAG: sulfotransferase [Erythrobacter sp.]